MDFGPRHQQRVPDSPDRPQRRPRSPAQRPHHPQLPRRVEPDHLLDGLPHAGQRQERVRARNLVQRGARPGGHRQQGRLHRGTHHQRHRQRQQRREHDDGTDLDRLHRDLSHGLHPEPRRFAGLYDQDRDRRRQHLRTLQQGPHPAQGRHGRSGVEPRTLHSQESHLGDGHVLGVRLGGRHSAEGEALQRADRHGRIHLGNAGRLRTSRTQRQPDADQRRLCTQHQCQPRNEIPDAGARQERRQLLHADQHHLQIPPYRGNAALRFGEHLGRTGSRDPRPLRLDGIEGHGRHRPLPDPPPHPRGHRAGEGFREQLLGPPDRIPLRQARKPHLPPHDRRQRLPDLHPSRREIGQRRLGNKRPELPRPHRQRIQPRQRETLGRHQ